MWDISEKGEQLNTYFLLDWFRTIQEAIERNLVAIYTISQGRGKE